MRAANKMWTFVVFTLFWAIVIGELDECEVPECQKPIRNMVLSFTAYEKTTSCPKIRGVIKCRIDFFKKCGPRPGLRYLDIVQDAEIFKSVCDPKLSDPCVDSKKRCPEWALQGECTSDNNWKRMRNKCRLSCQRCIIDVDELLNDNSTDAVTLGTQAPSTPFNAENLIRVSTEADTNAESNPDDSIATVNGDEEKCAVSKYVECMEPVHNATFGHEHGLFQDSGDLESSCPIITTGITCIRDYAKECGTEMISENFEEQFEKPARFLTKICEKTSVIRKEYLKASPCMRENEEDLEICSTKVQEFLAFHEADTEEKEFTMVCMYEMMLRACLMSTAAEKCGMEAATLMRKALIYSPSLGLQSCSKE